MLYQHSLDHPPLWQDSRTSKISCLSFSLPLIKFFHKCAEVSVRSTIVLPLLCSFRLTLLSCWNMSARYARREIKCLLSWLDTILFFPWWLRIDFNSYLAKLHTVGCVHLSLLLCILNPVWYVQQFKTHRQTESLTENQHCVVSDVSGSQGCFQCSL